MTESIILFLDQIPPTLATVIMSALPVTELRLSIPVAMHAWSLAPLTVFGLALIGNFIPFFPLYYGLGALRRFSEKRLPWLTRVIDKSVDRAEGRVKEKYARYGALALFLFTAIPLPMTGLWTATLAAVALKVPVRHALTGITCGIVVAGLIVTALSAGFI